MAEITAVKIPPFNFNDPQLWFSTCERTFALGVPKAITDTFTKFNYIVSNLPPEAAAIVRDLIITPDETDPYGAIKAQLIQRTGESSQQEIRKLLTGEELGDRKPSELLRTMNRRAASHNVPEELMLELFLQQLPTAVQTILASITPITVEKAAEVADRILEVSTPTVSLSTNAIASSSENRILQEIERLHKRIDDLTMKERRTPERRNSSRPRNRSRNRSFSRSRNLVVGITKSFKNELRNAFHHAAIKKKTNPARMHSIKLVSGESIFHDVLREFPEIVKLPSFSQEVKHNIKHFIETSGPPVFAKARRLAPDRLKIAKSEFQHMLNLGHVRPSKSNYASPLHIVPKKDSNDWRPVGDYRALNAQTKKDKYSIPNILDFTSELHGKNTLCRKKIYAPRRNQATITKLGKNVVW
ncbi:transposon Tf2-9 polyprotein [Trichonephila clavipes]|nr:transposon Tf2-9 polyprotein [Trichonephila clavipes]